MKRIGIIGGGFAGTMTAVQIIEILSEPCEIVIINERETFNKGIAFNPYSEKHLLNVVAEKMSAFPDKPYHFLDWVMAQPSFQNKDRTLIANSFLPRSLYGEYLISIWEASMITAVAKAISLTVIDSFVIDLDVIQDDVTIWLEDGSKSSVHKCVIATGNHLPRNPRITNTEFYLSKNYFQNPWKIEAVKHADSSLPILIIGNGLTMVDTVVGLLEQGFKGEIYSLSPHGFTVLPHRHNGMSYTKLSEDLKGDLSLLDIVKVINKHIKSVREFGVSAEPIIDSLRPHSQDIWKNLSQTEKNIFMSRLRHLWGVARHRIPLHVHDKIQDLRIKRRLHVVAGKLVNCQDYHEFVLVNFVDKKTRNLNELKVARVINCTGPETDLTNLNSSFLKNCFLKGILIQDKLKLGIVADTETFQIINSNGSKVDNLFTIGSNLKGELWESTAVSELRIQARNVAEKVTAQVKSTRVGHQVRVT